MSGWKQRSNCTNGYSNSLEQSNTKDNAMFSSNYDQLIDWLTKYK
jgi:hypothetical protein